MSVKIKESKYHLPTIQLIYAPLTELLNRWLNNHHHQLECLVSHARHIYHDKHRSEEDENRQKDRREQYRCEFVVSEDGNHYHCPDGHCLDAVTHLQKNVPAQQFISISTTCCTSNMHESRNKSTIVSWRKNSNEKMMVSEPSVTTSGAPSFDTNRMEIRCEREKTATSIIKLHTTSKWMLRMATLIKDLFVLVDGWIWIISPHCSLASSQTYRLSTSMPVGTSSFLFLPTV